MKNFALFILAALICLGMFAGTAAADIAYVQTCGIGPSNFPLNFYYIQAIVIEGNSFAQPTGIDNFRRGAALTALDDWSQVYNNGNVLVAHSSAGAGPLPPSSLFWYESFYYDLSYASVPVNMKVAVQFYGADEKLIGTGEYLWTNGTKTIPGWKNPGDETFNTTSSLVAGSIVPLPGSIVLVGIGLAFMGVVKRFRRS